jgi:hypothetical protein
LECLSANDDEASVKEEALMPSKELRPEEGAVEGKPIVGIA